MAAVKMEDILDNFDSVFEGQPKYNIPDRSEEDFYCRVCSSHMITLQAWESHILGKRHIKNVRKRGVRATSRAVLVRDVPSNLPELLGDVYTPDVAVKMDHNLEDFDSMFKGQPKYNIPDRSKSDFYCRVCSAHMMTLQAWQSHILGKRHNKNVQKPGGETAKTVVVHGVPSTLPELLEDVYVPVVGLSYMCELKRNDPFLDSSYTCYLCSGTFTKLNVVQHLITTKHRMNYLKLKEKDSFDMINNLSLKKDVQDQLVEQHAAQWEAQEGRGRVEVKVELSSDVPTLASWRQRKKKRSSYDYRSAPSTSSSHRNAHSRQSSVARISSATTHEEKKHVSQHGDKEAAALQRKNKNLVASPPKEISRRRIVIAPAVSSCEDKKAAMSSHESNNVCLSTVKATIASAHSADAMDVCEGSCALPAPQNAEQLQKPEEPSDICYLNDQTLHGITDIDLFRDAGMLDPQTQLDLLKYFLIENPPPTDTPEECKTIFESMKMMEMLVYESAMNKMSDEELEEIVLAIENKETDPFYKMLYGSARELPE